MSKRRSGRAAVTGIGVVAPNGLRTDAYWKSVREGLGVLDLITREGCEHMPLRVAGEVRSFDPAALVEDRFLVQTDRFSHFAMAAAALALDDAGLGGEPADPYSVGVVTAAGSGGGEFGQRELQKLWGKGSKYVGPYQSIAWFYAASTGQISIRGGLKGPCGGGGERRGGRSGRPRARGPGGAARHGRDGGGVGGGAAGPVFDGVPARLPRAQHPRRPRPRLPAVHREGVRVRA